MMFGEMYFSASLGATHGPEGRLWKNHFFVFRTIRYNGYTDLRFARAV
jgi:hypothetical protein